MTKSFSDTTIKQALILGQQQLKNHSDSGQLDSEILLCKALQCDRSYLYTWPDRLITHEQQHQFQTYLAKRQQNYPIAYITGQKDFWSLTLTVNESVLIPRPETELLVEITLSLLDHSPKKIADLGTGSGAIACALAVERPHWHITATDLSTDALDTAQHNAKQYQLNNILFKNSNWFDQLNGQEFDAIISNPPYIAPDDPHLQQNGLPFEPQHALASSNNGLADIQHLIKEAKNHLNVGGYLLLEHGYNQASDIQNLMKNADYQKIKSVQDLNGIDRVTLGRIN